MAQGRESPVRLYASDDTRLPLTLARKLEAEIDSRTKALVDMPVDRFDNERGIIKGLQMALGICREISEE